MSRLTFLATLGIFTFTGVIMASGVKSQNLKTITVDVHSNHTVLRDILSDLENKLPFSFVYSEDVGNIGNLNIPAGTTTLHDLLRNISKQKNLQFSQTGYMIAVVRAPVVVKPRPPGTLSGRVIDKKSGEALVGVSITVQGQGKGTQTDEQGHFSLSLAAGTYTLAVSYLGYKTALLQQVNVRAGETTELHITLESSGDALGTVVVTGDRLITTGNRKLVNEVKKASNIVSGISSEQITISVDRSATEVVRRVAGVTLKDGFISIRGMTPRYNPVYLNNIYMPSTDPNLRAFNFDLLPSNVIDRIMVYKTASPELPADFAGGVVKVYTKSSVPVRRLEITANAQYRTGNKFFGDHVSGGNGRHDWLGFDDGSRAIPKNMPKDHFGKVILPAAVTPPNTDNYTLTNEAITRALLQRTAKAGNLQMIHHAVDVMADITNYTYANLGSMRLNSVTLGRYEFQRGYYKSTGASSANRYMEQEFPENGAPLTPYYDDDFRLYYDSVYTENVRLALMQNLSLVIDKNHEIKLMGLLNRNTQDALQINTLTGWNAAEQSGVFPRRVESAYNTQQLLMGILSGSHKLKGGKDMLEWNGSFSIASFYDPNQFSNVYDADAASIIEGGEYHRLQPTENTTWRLNTFTRKNTVVGRFVDGEGDEKRAQGNIDYMFSPTSAWKGFYLKTGVYYEDRSKKYTYSSLTYTDYPEMPWTEAPWLTVGDDLLQLNNQSSSKMHTEVQQVGLVGSFTNGYEATFRNGAAYLSANLPFRFISPFNKERTWNLDLYGGVRFEYSDRKVFTTSGEQIRYEMQRDPVTGENKIVGEAPPDAQRFWLPSINANLRFSSQWQLRASYGQTLNRPELRELSPFVTYTPTTGFTYIGKPTLQDARIDNVDLRLEWYPAEGETVSAGVYYKYIKDPIEDISRGLNIGAPGLAPDNLRFARIKGVELEVRKHLDFIHGDFFRHLGIIINGSLNITETNNDMPRGIDGITNFYPGGKTRPFFGAAPWIMNAGLFYDNRRIGTRVSAQYNSYGDRLVFNVGGRVDDAPWGFDQTRHLFDVSVLQRINKRVSIRAAAQNLFNASVRWYVDGDYNKRYNTSPNQVVREYIDSPGEPVSTQAFIQGDYYIRNYKPGVYYTLGFQFNL